MVYDEHITTKKRLKICVKHVFNEISILFIDWEDFRIIFLYFIKNGLVNNYYISHTL